MMPQFKRLACLVALVLVLYSPALPAAEVAVGWVQTGALPAKEANQAAAADDRFVYAIDNKVVAKYDRATGELVSRSQGEASHLNSGFLHDGKLYCAHSNYPRKPEKSEIKVLDLESMVLSDFKSFGESPHGSLTVAVYDQNAWWCVFAIYGAENGRTVLVKLDDQFQEQAVWTFSGSVVSDLGKSSISGGLWQSGQFLATGHDKKVIYCLTVPDAGNVLVHVDTLSAPFPGQGIAIDPVTGGLVGIHRKDRQVLFAERP